MAPSPFAFTDFPGINTPANKHIKCHAGLDPASSPVLDSRLELTLTKAGAGMTTWICIVAVLTIYSRP
jgi:hypothetical protein